MDEISDNFGKALSIINRKALAYFSRHLRHLGLGPGQQAYLLAIAPGESVSQEELAQRLAVDKANVSRAAVGLERLGYIRRTQSEQDARVIELSLTEKGTAAQKETALIARAWTTKLKGLLAENEWTAAERALRNLADALKDHEL